jgi:hypothetical protein
MCVCAKQANFGRERRVIILHHKAMSELWNLTYLAVQEKHIAQLESIAVPDAAR